MAKTSHLYEFQNLPLALRMFVDDFEMGRSSQMKAAIRAVFVMGFILWDIAVTLRSLHTHLVPVEETPQADIKEESPDGDLHA